MYATRPVGANQKAIESIGCDTAVAKSHPRVRHPGPCGLQLRSRGEPQRRKVLWAGEDLEQRDIEPLGYDGRRTFAPLAGHKEGKDQEGRAKQADRPVLIEG
jgi:hypothetical protein